MKKEVEEVEEVEVEEVEGRWRGRFEFGERDIEVEVVVEVEKI